ncbi:MAG TPA: hypothetical protein P5080_01015 [Candidatus Paceibacterota bacterium]|nr:hypothetical protein [Candidatus Pacearchaeota archaeon]HRZ50553.1 hypothetical protein [Candidatus Paceibacterota bacterium]HSA36274.1 hypothetical protein [Candidatus Paceibacterota bacterium]
MNPKPNNHKAGRSEPTVQLMVNDYDMLRLAGKLLTLTNSVFAKRNTPEFNSKENKYIQGLLLTLNDWWLSETRDGSRVPGSTSAHVLGSAAAYSMILAKRLKTQADRANADDIKSMRQAVITAYDITVMLRCLTDNAQGINMRPAVNRYFDGVTAVLAGEEADLAEYEKDIPKLYKYPSIARVFTMTTDIGGGGDLRYYYQRRPDGSEQVYAGSDEAGKLFIRAMNKAKQKRGK